MAPKHKNKGARAAKRERIEQAEASPKPVPQAVTVTVTTPKKLPASINALHEASHAVFAALLDTEGFDGVDIIRRGPGEALPGPYKTRVPAGQVSNGFIHLPTPETVTPEWAWKSVIGSAAPMVLTTVLDYDDDGFVSDREDIRQMGMCYLGINDSTKGEYLDRMFRLAEEIMSDPAVLAGVINTARALDKHRELSADQVREILALHPVRPLPDEVQELINAPVLEVA
jgi:hypothetical protein